MTRRRGLRFWWWMTTSLAAVLLVAAPCPARAAEIIIYGFEGTTEGWVIPEWSKSSSEYVLQDLGVSQRQVQEGAYALELSTAFPGNGRWTGAYVEREVEVTDWAAFGRLAVSVYVPAEAPPGLRGRVILSVGDQWVWTEMNRAISLPPGEWTTITVNLKPGSLDWKFFPDETFRKQVRRLGVRLESDKQPAYAGSIFLDNVRLLEE